MLTVDFDRLGLSAGERVLDMGCGAGRHAFEMYRRGADVVAFDQDADELSGVLDIFGAMREQGEVPDGAEADIKQGDALALPFGDGEFDRIVAAEVINWKLSDDYHNVEGGHIRIYTDAELCDKLEKRGLEVKGTDYTHGLHSPYWWIKCAVGVNKDDHPLARAYHQILVWEIMKQPRALRWAGKVLDPLIGKSMVIYARKPPLDGAVGTPGTARSSGA